MTATAARTATDHRGLHTWRAEIRTWLEQHAPREPLPDPETGVVRKAHRDWEKTLFEAGYSAPHWPAEYGGRNADMAARIVFQEEYERVGAPPRLNMMGLMLAGPTIMKYGTETQKNRWLEPILRCDEVWCQGFSEPDAGSDLAGLRTRADREGDELVVNGQKIWTSGAVYSDWMLGLVRTSREGRPHDGITFLMIDMRTPGIEVRPITQINGRSGFCEVFLSSVRVPIENVMGEIGGGWQVAMNALGYERGVGRRTYVTFLRDIRRLKDFVEYLGLGDDDAIREELGMALRDVLVYRDHVGRVVAGAMSGPAGPEASYNKLYWSEMHTRIQEIGMRFLGVHAETFDGPQAVPGAADWVADYWHSRATRIFAGTNQVQKNIISERVLGLPKEPRR